MNYIWIPTLEHIALAKIGGRLWNHEGIKDLLKNACTPCGSKISMNEWPHIEGRVKENVSLLPLPDFLKEKVLGVIKPMGIQISRWLKSYGDNFLSMELPNEFFWTPQGTVDEKKTAKLLIEDESIDAIKRYEISCYYCLQNDVVKLWNKIPEEWKFFFYNDEDDPLNNDEPDFIDIWTYDIKGQLSKDKTYYPSRYTPYQYACSLAASYGNTAFVDHFLGKLTLCERKVIVRIAECVARKRGSSITDDIPTLYDWYPDMMYTLIKHMDKEQYLEILQRSHALILVCFLNWPWQNFFAETASHLWTFLNAHYYFFILRLIINKVTEGFNDFNYQKLLAENWGQCPNALKRSLLNDDYKSSYLLSKLFEIRDVDSIKLILRDATVTQKQKIISSENGENICKNLIYNEEWSLLKFFIQECISSRDEMIKFKADFQKSISSKFWYKDKFEGVKDKFDKFFKLLDDITYESNKRKLMEDDDSEVKRLVTEL